MNPQSEGPRPEIILNTVLHLTDEQFADLLIGNSPASVQEHLKACAQCSEEADRVSVAIGGFQQQTQLWAERRAAAMPPLSTAVRQPALPWLHRPLAWSAAALLLVLAAGAGISTRVARVHPAQVPIAKAEPAVVVQPASLKSDNDLLSAIDGELRADDSATVGAYGLSCTAHEAQARSAKRTAE